jgi:uncharacterized protein (TIGR01777 family)
VDVVVSGSTGLIGSALCPALEQAGHRVIRLVRNNGTEGTLRWDPARDAIDPGGFEGVDAVVHLAGAGIGDKRWTEERKREIRDSRTRGTTLLAESLAGLARKPSVLVSASAVGYYGNTGDRAVTEDGPPGDDFLARVCIEWEAATAPAERAGIRVACIRSGIVLTPNGGVLKRMLWPMKAGVGGRIGTGKQYMSWITLDDEVGAILHVLATESLSGAVNLTAPNPVTNADYTTTMGKVLRRPTAIPVPVRLLRIPYGMELVHSLLLIGQRVIPKKLDDSGYRFRHPGLEPALRALLDRPAA